MSSWPMRGSERSVDGAMTTPEAGEVDPQYKDVEEILHEFWPMRGSERSRRSALNRVRVEVYSAVGYYPKIAVPLV